MTKFEALPQSLRDKVQSHYEKMSKEDLVKAILRRLSNSDILKAISEHSK